MFLNLELSLIYWVIFSLSKTRTILKDQQGALDIGSSLTYWPKRLWRLKRSYSAADILFSKEHANKIEEHEKTIKYDFEIIYLVDETINYCRKFGIWVKSNKQYKDHVGFMMEWLAKECFLSSQLIIAWELGIWGHIIAWQQPIMAWELVFEDIPKFVQ